MVSFFYKDRIFFWFLGKEKTPKQIFWEVVLVWFDVLNETSISNFQNRNRFGVLCRCTGNCFHVWCCLLKYRLLSCRRGSRGFRRGFGLCRR